MPQDLTVQKLIATHVASGPLICPSPHPLMAAPECLRQKGLPDWKWGLSGPQSGPINSSLSLSDSQARFPRSKPQQQQVWAPGQSLSFQPWQQPRDGVGEEPKGQLGSGATDQIHVTSVGASQFPEPVSPSKLQNEKQQDVSPAGYGEVYLIPALRCWR